MSIVLIEQGFDLPDKLVADVRFGSKQIWIDSQRAGLLDDKVLCLQPGQRGVQWCGERKILSRHRQDNFSEISATDACGLSAHDPSRPRTDGSKLLSHE